MKEIKGAKKTREMSVMSDGLRSLSLESMKDNAHEVLRVVKEIEESKHNKKANPFVLIAEAYEYLVNAYQEYPIASMDINNLAFSAYRANLKLFNACEKGIEACENAGGMAEKAAILESKKNITLNAIIEQYESVKDRDRERAVTVSYLAAACAREAHATSPIATIDRNDQNLSASTVYLKALVACEEAIEACKNAEGITEDVKNGVKRLEAYKTYC